MWISCIVNKHMLELRRQNTFAFLNTLFQHLIEQAAPYQVIIVEKNYEEISIIYAKIEICFINITCNSQY